MKSYFVLFLATMAAASLEGEFMSWADQHGKSYESNEYRHRFSVWRSNKEYIDAHNAGQHTYTLAVNEFADLTNDEFNSMYLGFVQSPLRRLTTEQDPRLNVDVGALPTSVDWRTKGAVTPVKNQGQCGSCWSFSATGSMEGQHFLNTSNLVGLSEQNLIDCSTSEGNMGCDGGLMDDAFKYVISNKGIDTESSYPYTATGPNTCEYKASNRGATISSYHDIQTGSETDLQTAVAQVGPVSVAMDASHISFQFYDGGIYWSRFCSSTKLDHGVLAVGYGTASSTVFEVEAEPSAWNGKDYWIVKNSWGSTWGLSGYFKLARNDGNMCGVATAASYPIV